MRDKHDNRRDFKQIKVAGEYGLDEPKQIHPEDHDGDVSSSSSTKTKVDPDNHLGAVEEDEPARD